jgi:hypothetical protein
MQKYFFTFGSNMHDTKGRSLLGWYTMIEANTENEAREIYAAKFGSHWAFTYTQDQINEQIPKYNLQYEPFEIADICCGIGQDKYLQLKRKYNALVAIHGETADGKKEET